MPEPAFPAAALDSGGRPAWITELGAEDPHQIVHLVRDLQPREALEALGARLAHARPCTLPEERADEHSSLPRTALGETDCASALLAGRIGGWTFVFDDAGHTDSVSNEQGGLESAALALSRTGGAALSLAHNFDGPCCGLEFAEDGAEVLWTNSDDLEGSLPELPDRIREAVAAAGIVEQDHLDPGELDEEAVIRTGCVLAGITGWTSADVRAADLVLVPFG
ncbi:MULTISPECIES: hypothetical protein [unclassified Saccharopolyspora]|uniref:hypothetical protein n=1 Tax=unclassified Saccharopolyspora TaxID=2646250 RepID=UPI001CD6FA7D|nr:MULTISPECIES: hypothetical protein [unclassified Saccharopolyspora]MCA1189749.1 hypothetical protein [Saccharopolyspora sp. 6T]MCA1193974.1 hypothetical protein [Saccharopolyspora sp. 6V]MCA1228670.1 hypothetical protein [Saccharopolyspora sp. 6M]MCA1279297.1 hypothetical protein [Saccharopolyspora sp. 7B]